MSAPTFYQIDSAGNASSFKPSIGQKPAGVALPDSLLAQLGRCKTVFAASYSSRGKLTNVLQGVLKDGRAVFGKTVSRGWRLYFLDGDGAPVCPAYPVP